VGEGGLSPENAQDSKAEIGPAARVQAAIVPKLEARECFSLQLPYNSMDVDSIGRHAPVAGVLGSNGADAELRIFAPNQRAIKSGVELANALWAGIL
jgi:hypothetical protein